MSTVRQQTGYPVRPRTGWSGRHRGGRGGSRYIALFAGLLLLSVAVAGAILSPVLAGWTGGGDNGDTAQTLTGPPDGAPDGAAGLAPDATPTGDPTSTGGPDPASTAPTEAATRPATPSAAAPPAPTRAVPTRPVPPRPTTARTRAPQAPSTPSNQLAAFEDEVLALTNAERAKEGCAALKGNAKLRTAARDFSADMARNNYFSHTGRDGSSPGERMKRAGYDTSRGWAENIASGYRTPQAVMDGWMNSDGHRRNILNCDLKSLGVGAARVGTGQIYWTQDFGGL